MSTGIATAKLISVECILSRTSRCGLADGKFIDVEYPSHLWSARLDDGTVFMQTQMSEVFDWVLERTGDSDHETVTAMFQRVNELAAKQPDGHNR